MISEARLFLVAGLIALPVGGLVACGVGDELSYKSSGKTNDSGLLPDEAGRLVAESGITTRPPANDGGTLPPIGSVLGCPGLDPDGGCNTTEGRGCCLPGSAPAASTASNVCVEQIQVFGGPSCRSVNDVFLSCIGSQTDSTCCWQPGESGSGTFNTRFRSWCDGGTEACNPNGPDGGPGFCQNGLVCIPKTCKGVLTGGCGTEPPCQQ